MPGNPEQNDPWVPGHGCLSVDRDLIYGVREGALYLAHVGMSPR
jgi:hypothetical protein